MIGSSATDLVESEQYIAGLTNAKYSKCFVISSLLIQSNLFVRS